MLLAPSIFKIKIYEIEAWNMLSTHVELSLLKRNTLKIRQSLLYYAGSLGRLDNSIVDQASDFPSIISFHDFLQNSLQKYFQSICLFF